MTREELEKSLEFVSDEKIKLQNENELLKEHIKMLTDEICGLHNLVIGLHITDDFDDIEEI